LAGLQYLQQVVVLSSPLATSVHAALLDRTGNKRPGPGPCTISHPRSAARQWRGREVICPNSIGQRINNSPVNCPARQQRAASAAQLWSEAEAGMGIAILRMGIEVRRTNIYGLVQREAVERFTLRWNREGKQPSLTASIDVELRQIDDSNDEMLRGRLQTLQI